MVLHRARVSSSSIVAVGYDAAARVLAVEFVGGRTYHYQAVPRRIFRELMRAPSKGAYVNAVVKRRFAYEAA